MLLCTVISYACTDSFGRAMFRINSSTGVIDMPPTLDPFLENLNYEDSNPNPYVLIIELRDNGFSPAATNVTIRVNVLDMVRALPQYTIVLVCLFTNVPALPRLVSILILLFLVIARIYSFLVVPFS